MKNEDKKSPQDEIIEEEYMLGKEYYNKLNDKAKKDNQKYQ